MTLKSFLISAITNMSLGERTMNHTFVALIKFYHSFLASYFSLFLCRLPHLTQNLLKITNKSAGNASPRINSLLAPPLPVPEQTVAIRRDCNLLIYNLS